MQRNFVPNLEYLSNYLRAMQADVLIIGQGICGTMLSWFLHKEGKSFLIIDKEASDTASKVAAGVINPVTGRRYVTSWMADELRDFAQIAYQDMGAFLQETLLYPKSVIDFFPSPQMRNAFVDRISENDTYLHAYPDQNLFNPFFNYDFGCGEIKPAFTVHLQLLLTSWRKHFEKQQLIRNEWFVLNDLKAADDGIQYQDITAEKIIFCDGVATAGNSCFALLPFSFNKGEALIVECRELTRDHIFKKGMFLVPLPEENLFWLGSNYQWEFEDSAPTDAFYKAASELLHYWLKMPFSVVAHKAGIRPATLERRPFVGFHPQMPSVGILNGMGTKGASLAPFFAHQLVQHIVYNFPISPEANVHRFNRILSK